MNTHPIQYFAPLYAYLAQAEDIDITALYLSDFSLQGGQDIEFGVPIKWDVDLMSGYRSEFVSGKGAHSFPHGFWTYVCPSLWRILKRDRFDALWLHGHGFAANMLALIIARLRGIPVFMRAETQTEVKVGSLKGALRRIIMPLVYDQCAQLLAIGSRNRDHYRSLGIPEEKIALVPYTVDNARFAAAADAARANRADVRAHYGITDDRPVVLFASKLNYRKRAHDLVDAMALLAKTGVSAHLLIVGSGDQEPMLRQRVADLGLSDVHFAGFVNQAELPQAYAASDVFVLPSEAENWGLIVNEVEAAGLPVVVTREIGCVADLVRDGENGFVYETGDVAGLAAALGRIVSSPPLLAEMGAKSREIIGKWSYAECLAGIRQAVARVRKPV